MRFSVALLSLLVASAFVVPSVARAEDLVISSVTATPAATEVTIQWTTNQPASSQVTYGTTSSYGQSTTESDTSPRVTEHSVTVRNLQSCTTYHYQVTSAVLSFSVSPASSSDATFITAGCSGLGGTTTTTSDSSLADTGTDSLLYASGAFALLAAMLSVSQLRKQHATARTKK